MKVASTSASFELDADGEKVALKQLLSRAGYNIEREVGSVGDPIYKMNGDKCIASNVMLYMGEEVMLDLKTLTDSWRKELVNQFEKSKLEFKESLLPYSTKEKQELFSWLKSACMETKDGATICIFCGLVCYPQSSTFNFKSHARTHLQRELGKPVKVDPSKAKRSACPQCGKIFRPDGLKRHMLNVHKITVDEEVKLKECLFCQKMFPSREKGKHIMSEHKNDTIECKECKGVFTNEDKFTMHMRNVHIESKPKWCEICEKYVSKMGKHNSYYHRNKKSVCNHCQKTFRDSTSLRIHMRSVDGTVVRKKCNQCSKSFINLRDHIQGVHRKQLKPHQLKNSKCLTCYRWIEKADFDGHQLICETDTKTCEVCGMEVKRQKFDLHMTRNHAKCSVCNQDSPEFCGGGKRNGLRDHIFNKHMSDIFRELGLSGADEKTENPIEQDAIAEMLVKHKSEKQKDKFKCTLCNKLYSTLTVMMNHMKFHLRWNNPRQKILKACCPGCGELVRKGNVLDKHSCSAVEPTSFQTTFKPFGDGTKIEEARERDEAH